ncbi:hypothetical protein WJX73_010908 [Symbiochloris irregularis]|uniref:Kinesin motor domain-containing protein n=1 Tax=Symbiochloris irregularis TaxID=706552 RepID=A0AAW1NTA5_9CHLO
MLLTSSAHSQVLVEKRNFLYDHVYGWNGTGPERLYDQCVQPLVDGLFKGYNATVFAYGQTGSGKTYTMGSAFAPGGASSGVIPRAMSDIFERIESAPKESEFTIRVGFVEIYQESIRDLLLTETGARTAVEIQIREDGTGGICLAGAIERQVESREEMATLLEQGALLRATGATGMNRHSSRSHAIFTITVEQNRLTPAPAAGEGEEQEGLEPEDSGVLDSYLCAKMHLVDLAGSERLGRTQAEADRRAEGIAINKGLLSLGKVINALAEGLAHVPYRDSKLTRMLQDSLGGNSRTVMIACVSPADINLEESLSTLRYASRARAIKNKPVVNRDPAAAAIAHLRQQLAAARAEIVTLKRGGRPTESGGAIVPGWDNAGISRGDEVLVAALEEETTKRMQIEADAARLKMALADARAEVGVLNRSLLDAQGSRDGALQKLAALASSVGSEACAAAGVNVNAAPEADAVVIGHLEKIAELEREVRRLKKIQKMSGAMVVNARRNSMGPGMSPLLVTRTASSEAGSPMHATASPLAPSRFASLDNEGTFEHDLEGMVEDEEFALSEQAHMAEQARTMRELEELDATIAARQEQMAAMQTSAGTIALKQSYDKVVADLAKERDQLQQERTNLLQEMRSLQQSSAADRAAMEEKFKKRLADMDKRLREVRLKEKRAQEQERLYERAMASVANLESDIRGIKQQKVALQRQMDTAAKDFTAAKREREREVLQLRRQDRKTQAQVQKLQAANEKQQAVLRRKTEEAEAARKRLKEQTEIHRGAAEKRERVAAVRALQGIEVQPNNAAPLLRDEKARREWVEQELDMACQTIDLQRVLDGEKAQRADVARRLAELEKRLGLESDPAVAEGMRQQSQQLLAQQQRLSSQLAETNAALLKARQDEMRASATTAAAGPGPEVNRWMALKSIAEARSMLQTVFKAAAQQKAQNFENQQSLVATRDEADELRVRLEEAEAEGERSRQHAAAAQEAAAEAFAHVGSTPRTSPATKRRDSVMEAEYTSLMSELDHFKQAAPEPEQPLSPNSEAANSPASGLRETAPFRDAEYDTTSGSRNYTTAVDFAGDSEDDSANAEDDDDESAEDDKSWTLETATPAFRGSRRSRNAGRTSGMARSLAHALEKANISSDESADYTPAEEQAILEAINRERTQEGRGVAPKLTVPLLKEHLRGKLVAGAPMRTAQKRRDELIGAYRSFLTASDQDSTGQQGSNGGSSEMQAFHTARAPVSRASQGTAAGFEAADAPQSPSISATSPGDVHSHALGPSVSHSPQQGDGQPDSAEISSAVHIQSAAAVHKPVATTEQAAETGLPADNRLLQQETAAMVTPLANRPPAVRQPVPTPASTNFYMKQCADTLRRVSNLKSKMRNDSMPRRPAAVQLQQQLPQQHPQQQPRHERNYNLETSTSAYTPLRTGLARNETGLP